MKTVVSKNAGTQNISLNESVKKYADGNRARSNHVYMKICLLVAATPDVTGIIGMPASA